MTYQELFNIVVMLCGFLGAWVLKAIWDSIKELQQQNRMISKQLSDTELLIVGQYATKTELQHSLTQILDKLGRVESFEIAVANQYVRREELNQVVLQISNKLDRIENKLDSKVDKES